MKKIMMSLAMFGALTLSACAHGGHHSCCGDECKMDSAKKSCCAGKEGECKMDKKSEAAAPATEKTDKK